MSTPQPPSRGQAPADPSRPWLHQTDAPSTTTTTTQTNPQLSSTTLEQQQQDPSQQQQDQPRPRRPTIGDAVQTIKPADFLTVHQKPCARPGLLTGIGAGAATGALRWVMGLPIPKAANWAVGTGAVAALGQYEYCQFKRRQEREKMKRVVEVYGQHMARQREKEAEERRAREQREREEEERRRRWWKFW